MTRDSGRRAPAVGAAVAMLVLAGCASDSGGPAGRAGEQRHPKEQKARQVLHVAEPRDQPAGTLLEGPTFGDDGRLYLVDVTAPPGGPKVVAVDLATHETDTVYTDDSGAYTSAQFSPVDGRLYLTDYAGGRILSVTPDGEDPEVVAGGRVDGRPMRPDDLTFDDAGNMYVTDSSFTTYPDAEPSGRVLRFDVDTGEGTVLADHQPNPNGISFDLDGGALWVSQLDANRIDRLTLTEDGTAVTAGHSGMYVDGGTAQTDSNAVDAAGNVYQGMHGEAKVLVYAPDGTHKTTITVPEKDGDLKSATNLAIRPGTTEGYVTVSGPAGGYVYRFDALAEGVRESNGG
ncbi:SMP-30/gluconolactonase/LRE family protein [Saccharomonospora piscinae]|uniref:SMP-30/gluconolactonase/LRE family protein n=1 Tax=Saccharomonospora piscinae TaxID=687388 RepID=UPI000464BDA2|nr:SMP-30/gluconolactonase/LRE family protein [Saccharomonospora piscinae]